MGGGARDERRHPRSDGWICREGLAKAQVGQRELAIFRQPIPSLVGGEILVLSGPDFELALAICGAGGDAEQQDCCEEEEEEFAGFHKEQE